MIKKHQRETTRKDLSVSPLAEREPTINALTIKETIMITIKRLIGPLGRLAVSATLLSVAPSFAETAMQCSQKLHSTLYGRSATATELQMSNPLANVDAMILEEEFQENFAEFVNAHMNWLPAEGRNNNPVYMGVTRYLFTPRQNSGHATEYPWKNLFTEGYRPYDGGFNPQDMEEGAGGQRASGYFSDKGWKKTYKGNEEEGIKLRTAYLILNNQIGLNLEALTVSNSGGSGKSDRTDPNAVCYGCHVASDYGLDNIASILPRVNRETSDAQNFNEKPAESNSQVVYGQTVTDLKSLTAVLAERPEFFTNACAIAFEFSFGRERRGPDREVFDGCVEAFTESGYITTAVKYFVESDYFCKEEG